MTRYLQEAADVKSEVEQFLIESPGNTPEDFTDSSIDQKLRQLWTLVKVMRTARRSLRTNAAMYRYLKELFPYADFRDVPKNNKFGKGLSISLNLAGGQTFSDESIGKGVDEKDDEPPSGDGEG